MKRFFTGIYYSFSVQLLILHVRSNLLLLCMWGLILAIVSGNFGKGMGFHYMFLDPEYLNQVGFWSFFWIGAAFGVFYIAWNTSTYILNSYRFPFLASLSRPFTKFSINNFIIPFSFIVYYLYHVIHFQWYNELGTETEILLYCLGFIAGLMAQMFIVVTYFYLTNKDIATYRKRSPLKVSQMLKSIVVRHQEQEWAKLKIDPFKSQWRVDTYLTEGFRTRIVRDVRHYNFRLLERVFKQNHLNALVIQTVTIAALILMASMVESPYFRIPTAASMLLLVSVITTILGALTYWLREWRTVFFVLLVLFINQLMKQGLLSHENRAYGLNYETEYPEYSYAALESLCTWNRYREDVASTLKILENWRNKFNRSPLLRKPKMVFLCTSGGGLRASLWSGQVIRALDKQLGGKLFEHTILMTGASGGMLSAGYYRELYHLKKQGNKDINLQDDAHLDNVSKDLANALSFTFVVNDIFVPWVNREVNGYTYKQDRGYMFEQQLIENSGGILDKNIAYYREAEAKALIPMMFVTPVIINDGRFLVVSPQRVSYMMKPPFAFEEEGGDFGEIDGVDFGAFFEKQDAYNMRFATALRMSATYPFILPNVHLPAKPSLQIMDAGFRDNFGTEIASRFITVFRNWIRENTSGVVIVQIRAHQKVSPIRPQKNQSLGDLFNPIAPLLDVDNLQDYHHDNYIAHLKAKIGTENVDLVRFAYRPSKLEEKASMSLHLTQREKNDILGALYLDENQKSLRRMKELVR